MISTFRLFIIIYLYIVCTFCTHIPPSNTKLNSEDFINNNPTYLQPIGPGLTKIFPHLQKHEGKIILGNSKIQVVIKGTSIIENTLPHIFDIFIYQKDIHKWLPLSLVKSLSIVDNNFINIKAQNWKIYTQKHVSGLSLEFENNLKSKTIISFVLFQNQNRLIIIKEQNNSNLFVSISLKFNPVLNIQTLISKLHAPNILLYFTQHFEDEAFRIIGYQPFKVYPSKQNNTFLNIAATNLNNINNSINVYEIEFGKTEYLFDFIDPNNLYSCNPNNFTNLKKNFTFETKIQLLDRIHNCSKTELNSKSISIKIPSTSTFPYNIFIQDKTKQPLFSVLTKKLKKLTLHIPYYHKELSINAKPALENIQDLQTSFNTALNTNTFTINFPTLHLSSVNIINENFNAYPIVFFELIDLNDINGGSFLKFVPNHKSFKYLQDNTAQILKEQVVLKIPYGKYVYRVFTQGVGTLCTKYLNINKPIVKITCDHLKPAKIIDNDLIKPVNILPKFRYNDPKHNLLLDIYTQNSIQYNLNNFDNKSFISKLNLLKANLSKDDIILLNCPSDNILPTQYNNIIKKIIPDAIAIFFCSDLTTEWVKNLDFSQLNTLPIITFNTEFEKTLWHPYPPQLLKLNTTNSIFDSKFRKHSSYILFSGAIITDEGIKLKQGILIIKAKIFLMPDIYVKKLNIFNESQLLRSININKNNNQHNNYIYIDKSIAVKKPLKKIRLEVIADIHQKIILEIPSNNLKMYKNNSNQNVSIPNTINNKHILKKYINILVSASDWLTLTKE